MKKIYFSIFTCIAVFSLEAQYTITSASNPVPGDLEHYKDIDTAGIFLGSSGTGQTWNYTGVTISTVATTPSTYVAVSSIPNNALFPGATIGSTDGSGSYDVYSNNSTKIELMGTASSTVANCILYSNPIKLYSLPFSYGTVSTDNFGFTATGYTVNGTFTVTGDGTGTLQLPGGTYSNVLKQKYLIYETINFGTGVVSATITQSSYYSALSKFSLLTVSNQTNSTVSGTNTSVSYNKNGQINASLLTGINEKSTEFSELNVFPNPSSNGNINVTFNMKSNEHCDLTVINSLGQMLRSFTYSDLPAGMNEKKIDLSDLENGIYFLKLKSGSSEQVKRLAISR